MRRRRNQTHARNRETQLGDVFRYLMAWQLTAFTGLSTLRHLDLNLIRTSQVFGSHTETTGCDLLNLRAQGVTRFEFAISFDTALTDDVGEHFAALEDREA